MKRFALSLIYLLCFISVFAQAPQSFRYQTVVRNNLGELLPDKSVGLKISILKNSPTGMVVYSETYNLITNSLGMINLSVGTGLPLSGSFGNIDWGNGEYFLRIDVDKDGGLNFEYLGTSQLLSVPYALYAEKAGNGGTQSELYWKRNGNSLYYNDGFVGIGTTSPVTRLNLVGTVDDGDERSFIRLKNNSLGPKATVGIALNSFEEKGAAFGYTSSNYVPNDLADFGVFTTNGRGFALVAYEGQIRFYTNKNSDNSYSEKMRIDKDGHVGIGTINPERKLQVISNVDEGVDRELVLFRNLSSSNKAYTGFAIRADDNNYGLGISFTSTNYNLINDFHQVANITTNGRAMAISAYSPEGSIRFFTNKDEYGIIERMRIDSHGNIGIGTKTPVARLEIADGDIYIQDVNKGIIMTSPDGQCWRGTINNSGVLQFAAIPCP